MFVGHIRLIEAYPALAKLVFSDHLRQQYPSLRGRFSAIHKAYMVRLCGIIEDAKIDGTVRRSVAANDAATMFLSLIQGLGFQFAIARLPIKLATEGERIFALYLRSLATEK